MMTAAIPSLQLPTLMCPLVSTSDAPADDPRADEQLLTAYAVANDRRALELLLRRHLDRSWRLARRLGGSAFEADEVVQRTWIAVMRHAHRYQRRPQGTVGAWILGIVLRCERQRAREERRRARWHVLAGNRPQPPPSDANLAACADLHEETARALATLTERYRLPVTLRYLEGMEYPHLAQVLGIPERTARTRVARGLQRLRQQLGPAASRSDDQLLAGMAPLPLLIAPSLLRHLTQTCTVPVVPVGGLSLVTTVLISALVVGPLSAAVVSALRGRQPPSASAHHSTPPANDGFAVAASAAPAAPVPAIALETQRDPGDHSLDTLLATPVSCQIYHARDLQALPAMLPDGLCLPMAWPVPTGDYVPWSGTTLVFHQTPLHLIIDRACRDLGMRYQARHGRLLMSMATPTALAEVIAHGLPHQRIATPLEVTQRYRQAIATCRALVLARSTPALRAVLLMLSDDDALVARAAHDCLVRYLGTPWPTDLVGNAYLALRDDPAVTASVQHAEPVSLPGANVAGMLAWHGDPYLIYLRGLWPDADTIALQQVMLKSIPRLTHLHEGSQPLEGLDLWCVQLMSAASSDQPDPRVVAALRQQLQTQPLTLPRQLAVALAYASARLGDDQGVARILAAWDAFTPAGGPDLDHDDDDCATVLIDATVEAALQCPRSQDLLAALVAICAGPDPAPRRGAAATALVRIRDPRTTALILDAGRRQPGLPPEAMSVLIGMGLRSECAPLHAFDAHPLNPDLHVLTHAAECSAGDADAVARLQADGEDPQRRSAARLMACQDGNDAAIALLVRWSREHPQDGSLLQDLGMSRHPWAIGSLVERLTQRGVSDPGIDQTIDALAASGDAQASLALTSGILAHQAWSAHALLALDHAQWPLLSAVTRAASAGADILPDRASIDHLQDPDQATSELSTAAAGAPNRTFLVMAVDNALLDEPWHDYGRAEAVLSTLARTDRDAQVRGAALDALADLTDPLDDLAVVRVFAAASTDADATVRKHADHCLDNVRGYLLPPAVRLIHLGVPTHQKEIQELGAVLAEPLPPLPKTVASPPGAGF